VTAPRRSAGAGLQVSNSTVVGDLTMISGVDGSVTVGSMPAVRSAYRQTVQRISPLVLTGRDVELAELAEFCVADSGVTYRWLRAEAWAGKSALLAWFVLHPPENVDVVSFFVTARFAAQSDRTAFVDVVLEQLAERLRRSMPAFMSESTREAHLLQMLHDAAHTSQEQGRRLVLVVDGLDEDRGVTARPDAYSIAALLPSRPPCGMRVVVSGRHSPPIPVDVPADHPLRDRANVRVLSRSEHARVVQADLERELKRLLHGGPVEQELLGLVTAAGGGLSCPDLCELTGRSAYEVDDNLRAVAGRTFTVRPDHSRTGMGPDVYVLGHEELHRTAVMVLGESRLAGYRERLHVWADRYRGQGWPAGTPAYLLRGYYRMLHAAGDVRRVVACASDAMRHNRMLDVTYGDAAALAEIRTAHELLLTASEPDLHAMAVLAIHRDYLTGRNATLPAALPAAWALLGNTTRAESIAAAISEPLRLVQALTLLAEVAAAAGDRERLTRYAGQAIDVAGSMAELEPQSWALSRLAASVASHGDLATAGRAAAVIADPFRKVQAQTDLASIRGSGAE